MSEPLVVHIDNQDINTFQKINKAINSVVMTFYVVMAAWQTAKLLVPELEVQETILKARFDKKFMEPRRKAKKDKENSTKQEEYFSWQVESYLKDEPFKQEMSKRPVLKELPPTVEGEPSYPWQPDKIPMRTESVPDTKGLYGNLR